jgi:hypothetical protein
MKGIGKALQAAGRFMLSNPENSLARLVASKTLPPSVRKLAQRAQTALKKNGREAMKGVLYLIINDAAFRSWLAREGAGEMGLNTGE